MKTGKLRRTTSFWRSLFFMGNVCKMRKSLMGFLHEEGLKCKLSDGAILFEFNDCHFAASFSVEQHYGECVICYRCTDEDYERLGIGDKTFIADKVNADMENHVTVLAFDDRIDVVTSFYFTDENMMLDLFAKHFEEMTASIAKTVDIICTKVQEQKNRPSRKIGFDIEAYHQEEPETDNSQVAAKA